MDVIPESRARFYRLVFIVAAFYNAAFGLWAALRPLDFFYWFELDTPRYPSLWACLGMVVGVYACAYAYASRYIERAVPFIAIGLLGKVLGPIGWIWTVQSGELPARTLPLVVFNDILWWAPFGLFLLEGTRTGARLRRTAPYVCGATNLLAAFAMLMVLRHGTEVVPDANARLAYIRDHQALWMAGWFVWMAAAITLLLFYAWWASSLVPRSLSLVPRLSSLTPVLIAALGVSCDLFAESLLATWLPANYDWVMRLTTIVSAGVANGLYTVAGIILTLWTPSLRGALRVLTWTVWAAGVALSGAAATGNPTLIAAAAGALFPLFCPWVVLIGRHLDP